MIDPVDLASSLIDAMALEALAELDPDGPLRPGDAFAYGWRKIAGRRRPGHCALVVTVPGYTGPTPDSVRAAIADLGMGTYELGGGGLADDGIADCSGWLLEKLGVKRVQPCAGWDSINTSAMVADTAGPRRIFRPVPLWGRSSPWGQIGLIDCSSSHRSRGAVGRRNGLLWAAAGVAIRLV